MTSSVGDPPSKSAAAAVGAARDAGVELVRFEYCDLSGVARTKAVHVSQLAHKLVEGVGLTRAQMSINLLDQMVHVGGMEPVGEIRLCADPATFTVLPWVPASAAVLCDQLGHDRLDWGACPRSYLKRMIGRAAAVGLHIEATFENEYYLARPLEGGGYLAFDAPGHAPVYSAIGHDHGAAIMVETVRALEAERFQIEAAINEYGPGQQEISVRHADPLRAADNQMIFRDTVRGVALRYGLIASFAPKPYPNEIGSGAHIHLSLWDTTKTRNLMYDPEAEGGLATLGGNFIAGVAEHLLGLVALTAPSYNSFRRLRPGAWSSATTAWGFDNKEAALRVASPFFRREEQTYNLEFKPSDASANPYLSLGALIACGVDGVRRGLEPGSAADHDPSRLTAAELAQGKIRPLPTTMRAALDQLEADDLLIGSLGDLLGRSYLTVRRSECDAFESSDDAFEFRNHFYRF